MGNLEEIYIIKRRIKAFFHSLVYYACHIFPVQKNKIVMWTFKEVVAMLAVLNIVRRKFLDEILCISRILRFTG